jgi:predicted unusual protein kinase regulating ubiquinone biosynthesis (AarF/ABC1/UbiB family)
VAVKVQYPGIAEAIHADMQNLRLGLKLLSAIAPGIDTGAIASEIRERIGEELDYELEASNHRQMARAYRGHPFIVVPDVVTSLCRERVIVSEFVDGRRFAEVRDRPQEQRDRYGEILIRFYLNGPLRHRLLNGDPHPGNSLFLDDGRVAFLDFGFFKHLSDTDVTQLKASTRATYDRDAQALLDVIAELGSLPPDPSLAEPFLEHYHAIFGWLMADEPVAVDPSNTAEMMRRYSEMRRSEAFDGMMLPAEHFVLLRAIFLLLGLLGQLQASGRWMDVSAEWLFDAPPATELGRAEAAFFGDPVAA